jgi:hypothetical protein
VPASEATRLVPGGGGVLLLSMRRLSRLVAFCQHYELEDVVAEVTGADRVEVGARGALERSRRAYRLARFGTRSRRIARALAPLPGAVRLERDYELFFPVFNNAYELYALNAVEGWRQRSRKAACFVSEIWRQELPGYLVELLAPFDHVFVGVRHPVEEVARIAGRPCTYLPLAADVLRFAPPPDAAERPIDVCNIGRRSPVTHAALLERARERPFFYYYDTVAASGAGGKQRTFTVDDAAEHRLLLAGLLRRSRYFIANRGRVNEPEFTRGRDEVSGRFYEGAAAGTVMLGEAPRTDEFARQFDWPDAVIPLPFDSPDVGRILDGLDQDPGRLAAIRRDNVAQSALRHDWGRRLRAVYDTLGLAPTRGMLEREQRLDALAARTRAHGGPPARVAAPGR